MDEDFIGVEMKVINSCEKKTTYSQIFCGFLAIFFLIVAILLIVMEPVIAFVTIPLFILSLGFICFIISDFTKCFMYDDEKLIQKMIVIKRTFYYKDIISYGEEDCWSNSKLGKMTIYKKDFFTLKNGKKIENHIFCEKKEFSKLLNAIKKANPQFQILK